MTFRGMKDVIDAEISGKARLSTFRKAPVAITAIGHWFDLSMSPGNPTAQYYASSPLEAKTLSHSQNGGIFHGKSVAPEEKFLRRSMIMTQTAAACPMPIIICDYLLYYPFIDESDTEPQPLVNDVPLSRYTDGEGVKVMAISLAAHATSVSFQFTYTNSQGVTDRVSQTVSLNLQGAVGTVITSSRNIAGTSGPFIPLQDGDTGVRSIQSVQMNGAEVGLFALVLVKPIAQLSITGIDAPVEIDYLRMGGMTMPKIEDDAYLNIIIHPGGTIASSQINGFIETVWG